MVICDVAEVMDESANAFWTNGSGVHLSSKIHTMNGNKITVTTNGTIVLTSG